VGSLILENFLQLWFNSFQLSILLTANVYAYRKAITTVKKHTTKTH
jgi:hypothetical protein